MSRQNVQHLTHSCKTSACWCTLMLCNLFLLLQNCHPLSFQSKQDNTNKYYTKICQAKDYLAVLHSTKFLSVMRLS